jgi:Arc/MetJ family transcription regulator
MANALTVTGLMTKREVVELGLSTLVSLRRQAEIGRLGWEGDLEPLRSSDDSIVTPDPPRSGLG